MTHEEAAQKVGLDWRSVDWAKILQIIQAILVILSTQKAMAKAAGCSEHDQLMQDTATLGLQVAFNCVQCCCNPPPC